MTGGLRSVFPPFRLETYFSRWEFAARHHLTASDSPSLSITQLLSYGTETDRAEFDELTLGYTPTWGTDRLRTAIAATYEDCTPDDVLVFAGAEESIFWSMQVLAGPGDHVIVTAPNYQALEAIPLTTGAEVTGVLLDESAGWRLDLDLVRAALRPTTRVIAVNFPNNPTGALPDHATWLELVELCAEREIRLVSDEVYRGLELDPAATLTQAADLDPRAVSINVMSKSYGLPGLRVGWIACRDHDLLAELERHKHYTSICNAGPSEFLAAVALGAGDRIQRSNRDRIARNLPHFDAFFDRHPDLFEWAHPDAGCVAFPKYLGADGVETFCRELVQQAGVLLLPASVYTSAVARVPSDRFRIGVGRDDPQSALAVLEQYLGAR